MAALRPPGCTGGGSFVCTVPSTTCESRKERGLLCARLSCVACGDWLDGVVSALMGTGEMHRCGGKIFSVPDVVLGVLTRYSCICLR